MSNVFRRRGDASMWSVVSANAAVAIASGAFILGVASMPTDSTPSEQDWEAYLEMVWLRTEQDDCAAALDLANVFLDTYPEYDILRQLVHYERASALRETGMLQEALDDYVAVAVDYPALGLELSDEYCKTDDAEFYVGIVTKELGDVDNAVAILIDLYNDLPTSDCAVAAVQQAMGFLAKDEHSRWHHVQRGLVSLEEIDAEPVISELKERCVAEHPEDPATGGVIHEYIRYVIVRGKDAGTPPTETEELVASLVDEAVTLFPSDSWAIRCFLGLADVKRHNDLEGALLIVDQAIAMADSAGDDALRIDARLDRGRFLKDAKRYDEAYATFLEVYETMPVCDRSIKALGEANHVLMRQESKGWCMPTDDPTLSPSGYDNFVAIRANLDRVIAEHAETQSCLEVLGGYPEYLYYRSVRKAIDNRAYEDEMLWLVATMQQIAPDSDKTLYVHIQLAEAIAQFDPERALDVLEPLLAEAEERGLARCRLDGSLLHAYILSLAAHYQQARAVWEDELARGFAPWEPGSVVALQLEVQTRSHIAWTYVSAEHDSERAIADFEAIAATERYSEDERAAALHNTAFELLRLHRGAEIQAVMDEIVSRFANSQLAQSLRDPSQPKWWVEAAPAFGSDLGRK